MMWTRLRMIFARLWSLQYPRRYRKIFMYYYEQWQHTDRREGSLWWAANVFGEYAYPGWGTGHGESRPIKALEWSGGFWWAKEGR